MLLAVARSAEAGHRLPLMRLATASQFIMGRAGSARGYNEASAPGVSDEIAAEWHTLRGKGYKDAYDAALQEMSIGWSPVVGTSEPDPPATLTVYDALTWGFGETNGLRVPVVRVRLDAVSAWWVGRGKQVKGQAGGSFFVGGLLPIGN